MKKVLNVRCKTGSRDLAAGCLLHARKQALDGHSQRSFGAKLGSVSPCEPRPLFLQQPTSARALSIATSAGCSLLRRGLAASALAEASATGTSSECTKPRGLYRHGSWPSRD